MSGFKKPKYFFFYISLFVAVFAIILLIFLYKTYVSQKVYKIKDFETTLEYRDGLLVSGDSAFLFSEIGGTLNESDLYSLPLSQFNGPEHDFYYYSFNSRFYGANAPDNAFSGANSESHFLFKLDNTLYLITPSSSSCAPILENHNIISTSTNGTYFLEKKDSQYYFHKKISDSFDFKDPQKLILSDAEIDEPTWVNDRYALIKSLSKDKTSYYVADAENGECSPLYTIENSSPPLFQKLFANKYFVKSIDENSIVLFSIWTQEDVVVKLNNAEKYNIVDISDNSSYLILKKDDVFYISSKSGNVHEANNLLNLSSKNFQFVFDNILIVNTTNNTSSIFKLFF